LTRLVVEFSPTDGQEDGENLFIQTNPLKQVHIVDTSVGKLSTAKGLILLHLLSGADRDVAVVRSLRKVIMCKISRPYDYHQCYFLGSLVHSYFFVGYLSYLCRIILVRFN
jgi:hypothetical protein